VGDTGHGIPPNQWEEVFTPFRSNKEGHSGLGLAYCRNVVRSAGGSIKVKTSGEKGTVFQVSLPILDLGAP